MWVVGVLAKKNTISLEMMKLRNLFLCGLGEGSVLNWSQKFSKKLKRSGTIWRFFFSIPKIHCDDATASSVTSYFLSVHITHWKNDFFSPFPYKIVHLIFFRGLSFSFLLLPSVSIFRARISLMRSKKTLSTFSRVFAEVSTYGTFHSSAWARAFANVTALRSVRSLLLPTRINGIVSSPLTRRICSRNSCVAWKKKMKLPIKIED